MRPILIATRCKVSKPTATGIRKSLAGQELLGHSTLAITLDTYPHVPPGMGGAAAEAMDEALG